MSESVANPREKCMRETPSSGELEQKEEKKALAMKLLHDRQVAERQQLNEKLQLLEEKLMAGEEEWWREQLTAAQQQFATASMHLTERHVAQRKRLEANLLAGGETPAYAGEEEEVLPITTFVPFGYLLDEHKSWIPLMEPIFDSFFAKTLEIKTQMCELFGDNSEKLIYHDLGGDFSEWDRRELREKFGLGKYDDRSFLRILAVLVSMEKFRKTYGLSLKLAFDFRSMCEFLLNFEHSDLTSELSLIWYHYNPGFNVEDIRDVNEGD